MPTVIMLDVSLSMARPVVIPDCTEEYQRIHLAVHGISTLLDYIVQNCKLEFTALVSVASTFKLVTSFSRDFEFIRTALTHIEIKDKAFIEESLDGVRQMVLEEWGAGCPCNLIYVTDGNIGIGPMSLKNIIKNFSHRDPSRTEDKFPLPFPFPAKISVMMISANNEPHIQQSVGLFQKLIEINGDGQVYVPEGPLSIKSVQAMFAKLAEVSYTPFHGTLVCGALTSQIQLAPSPEQYVKTKDTHKSISSEIVICGFMQMGDIASPAARSRHLVLPLPPPKGETNIPGKMEVDGDDDQAAAGDEGKAPSFCVLLHGSLKVEGMVALVHLGADWYGMLYSWADSKKKSNLMLTVFEPGVDVIPWVGNLNQLGCVSEFSNSPYNDSTPAFPVRPAERKSYAQNCVVWIRQSGLHADIQKILRHARKLPEKTQNFYKELNRLRKAALSFGFVDLLIGIADILERECTLLPGSTHPDAALQLTHAVNLLRSPQYHIASNHILPLPTKFTTEDLNMT